MDRLTHAEVGGPYSNAEDAERAIRAGNFDQDPAELSVQEGDSDSDDQDGGSTTAVRRTAAFEPYESPSTGAAPGPNNPGVPPLGQPVPEQQFPQTTKPAQMPSGGGGPDTLPQDPSSAQFDPQPMSTPGPDPMASATAAVVAQIRQANPSIDDETLVRVASKAVARLVEADFDPFAMMPSIHDPLANKTPFGQKVKDPDAEKEDDEDGDDGEDDKGGDKPGGSPLPRLPLPNLGGGAAGEAAGAGAAGEAAAGAGAAGEAAGAARLLPMLLL